MKDLKVVSWSSEEEFFFCRGFFGRHFLFEKGSSGREGLGLGEDEGMWPYDGSKTERGGRW